MNRREELFWALFLMGASAAWGYLLALTVHAIGR